MCVTLLGFGAMGQAIAAALVRLGYNVVAWRRSLNAPVPRRCRHVRIEAGKEGLAPSLMVADVVVNTLPDTAETRGLLNSSFFG